MPRAGRPKALPGDPMGDGVEPFVLGLRAVGLADQVRASGQVARAGIAILSGIAIGHVERRAAQDEHVGVQLPAAQQGLRHAVPVVAIGLVPAERQLVDHGRGEVVRPVEPGRPLVQIRIVDPPLVVVVGGALQRVVHLRRPALAEAPGELGLQRLVPVVRLVGIALHRLRPAVVAADAEHVRRDAAGEERTALVGRHALQEPFEGHLVQVLVRVVAGEHVAAVVADVGDLPPTPCRSADAGR